MTFRPLILLALLAAGCAPVYGKPGITEAEGQRDAYECHRESLMLPRTPQAVTRGPGPYGAPIYADPTMGWGDVALSARMLDLCMRARGYTKQ
jgi:hypothetical protein